MKVHAIVAAFVALASAALSGCAESDGAQQVPDALRQAIEQLPHGSITQIDRDGDGYGVGCPAGPDADDSDPEVNTPESVIRRYGSLAGYLAARGVNPERYFYLAPDGDDESGQVDQPDRPFATFEGVRGQLRPGDAVIFAGGTYNGRVSLHNYEGEPDRPLIIMGAPGERVVMRHRNDSVTLRGCSHVVIENFVCEGEGSYNGVNVFSDQARGEGKYKPTRGITVRSVETVNRGRGIKAMYDLQDVTFENIVVRDSSSHGIYLGATVFPNSDITVRGCVVYNSGRHGIQHNGKVTNLVVTDNIAHSNRYGGISLLLGVSDSTIARNLLFNNARQGIIFFQYNDRYGFPIQPQSNNRIEGNLVWIGYFSPTGKTGTKDFAPMEFTDSTTQNDQPMADNVIRNNILITQVGPVFKFGDPRFAQTNDITGNWLHRASGPAAAMRISGDDYSFEELDQYSARIADNVFMKPRFAAVDLEFWQTPEKFDFHLPGSAATGPTTRPGESQTDEPAEESPGGV